MVKQIRFTIDANGEVKVNVEGAVGSACEDMTAPFEAALGQVVQKSFKDTYFQESESVDQEVRQP